MKKNKRFYEVGEIVIYNNEKIFIVIDYDNKNFILNSIDGEKELKIKFNDKKIIKFNELFHKCAEGKNKNDRALYELTAKNVWECSFYEYLGLTPKEIKNFYSTIKFKLEDNEIKVLAEWTLLLTKKGNFKYYDNAIKITETMDLGVLKSQEYDIDKKIEHFIDRMLNLSHVRFVQMFTKTFGDLEIKDESLLNKIKTEN